MVLVFGTVCIDRVRRVEFLPSEGGYVEIQEQFNVLGGEAANTANALRQWGIDCELWGNSIGEGIEASVLKGLLEEKGLVNRVASTHIEPPTPVCDVFVTPGGERTMFGHGFSKMDLGVDASKVPFGQGIWFTAEGNMRIAAATAARLAGQAGMRLYLMDYINPSEVPTGAFWQCSTDWVGTRSNTQKNVAWVQEWVAKTGTFAILSDGPNGFVAGSAETPVRAYPPYPAPLVVDTTGAGDMFRAGMLYSLTQDWPIHRCLQFASAAGCLKCRALGATTDVPTVSEIVAHIDAHPSVTQQYS